MTSTRASEDAVFQALHDAILSRRLAPGIRLRETGLGEIFGASRRAVRKALDRLNFEGLVVHAPNRDASAAQPTAQEAEQLGAARKCTIEDHIDSIAAEIDLKPRTADTRRLEDILLG
jgi:DNA-binding GntR family transcriptional regulator